MDTKQAVVAILKELTGTDVSNNLDDNLFDSGMIDSMATVEMLLELQEKFGIDVPVSEFDRSEWDTPNKVIAKVESMK
ncbi:D-alanine--poly(phosphoribitol) ligase subunit DltC [Loigolactobacillus coryniformis]|jgi:D-alanine--poly(phosphoribitol) ligase subunit 2|uniref:D-alanyl carrier protein n=2 Tax=Loigolactobacillus coryniformis TaxID=1610 RepID=A0A0R1F7T4_9LACO|nr:D-alanine--poly(phosphoribitol) ligase subunit DltC [Loigolactobacillus coryniformis]MDT3392863.1 D-alanine--poly(phosphoribitol) ligase subunit DltC [Bacillota bacterium]OEH89937.1 D-alanine--poly(phosphoribitol) ligase subunit 2 [Loigolactobacillus coryniformis subsp. coryniformis]RRG05345.1 MAG: D-alanine--poly(phosphoribitol) ligase subunit DltC [Lactobacillus sp.]ATO54233.1 D-alanine--poly(phosphoribitol) ligase subunit 2 [Loigolactobacillus coryniformis subsp. coryniformis KCTC 3167 = 